MLRISIKLRSLARRLGLIRPLQKFLRAIGLGAERNEQRFHDEMQRLVGPGDVAWDIGANVGVYTNLFSQWVQSDGRVFAFEPAVGPFAQLCADTQHCSNVRPLNYAMGSYDGTCEMLWNDRD